MVSGKFKYRYLFASNGLRGLAGEVIYEAVKFIIMLLLLAGGVVIGGKLRTRSDAKKEAKNKEI